jgi:hypothetical protein
MAAVATALLPCSPSRDALLHWRYAMLCSDVLLMCCAVLWCAEGAIDEAMAEVLDEDYPGGGMMNGGGGGGFVV